VGNQRDDGAPPGQPTPTGYRADGLDKTLARYIGVCESNIHLLADLVPKVESLLKLVAKSKDDPETALITANQVTVLYDRMSKAGLNIVKALDELSRLRSFVAGGPDTRPDLLNKGEHELRALVRDAAIKFGLLPADAGAPAPDSTDTVH
jgi:hypothetical protein